MCHTEMKPLQLVSGRSTQKIFVKAEHTIQDSTQGTSCCQASSQCFHQALPVCGDHLQPDHVNMDLWQSHQAPPAAHLGRTAAACTGSTSTASPEGPAEGHSISGSLPDNSGISKLVGGTLLSHVLEHRPVQLKCLVCMLTTLQVLTAKAYSSALLNHDLLGLKSCPKGCLATEFAT